MKTNKTGVPFPLRGFYPLLRHEDPGVVSVILTSLTFYNSITGHSTTPDFSSIEGGCDTVTEEQLSNFEKFLSTSSIMALAKEKKRDVNVSTVQLKGSQGVFMQSFFSIPFERRVLNLPSKAELKASISMLSNVLRRRWLVTLLEDSRPMPKRTSWEKLGEHSRKITVLREPAFKDRIVTACDFFSQNALKPIHDIVMGILGNIKHDATYRAQEVINLLKERGVDRTEKVVCLDLSNFTDNLSIKLQTLVVAHLFNPLVSRHWERIMREPCWLPSESQHHVHEGATHGITIFLSSGYTYSPPPGRVGIEPFREG
jgi:hypothetical protein